MGSLTLEPGKYWFGDPCYALSDEDYDLLLAGREPSFRQTDDVKIRDSRVIVAGTAHGDGYFDGFGVDSGQLAVVAADLVAGESASDGMFFSIRKTANVTFDAGVFRIDRVVYVNTNYGDPEED